MSRLWTSSVGSAPRPHVAHRAPRLALLLLALAVAPAMAAAQVAPPAADSAAPAVPTVPAGVTLAGIVSDSGGRPLSGAEVRSGVHVTLSGADGAFELPGLPADTIQVLVRRIGYLPADVLIAVDPGVGRIEVAVRMVPSALELGTIVIEGQEMDTRLWRTGFYGRQKAGFGRYFDPEFLEQQGAPLSGLMQMVPGVRIERGAAGAAIAYGQASVGYCPLKVFLDGMLLRWAPEVGLDQILNRHDILAVEVYPRATQMPATLSGYSGGVAGGAGLASPGGVTLRGADNVDCGALVIWSKPM